MARKIKVDTSMEIRRTYCGSTYWLRTVGPDRFMVTADGTAISNPSDYQSALEALKAVAPEGD